MPTHIFSETGSDYIVQATPEDEMSSGLRCVGKREAGFFRSKKTEGALRQTLIAAPTNKRISYTSPCNPSEPPHGGPPPFTRETLNTKTPEFF